MSKQLKNMIVSELQQRLTGVNDALLVDVIGLDSANTFSYRKALREKNINVLVVKNSLARRATEGTSIAPAFTVGEGSLAIVWGAEDFIALCKEIVDVHKRPEFEKAQARGGVMDGEPLTPKKVEEVSKWPNRREQLSLLLGQILSPGANLLSQLKSPAGALASQIKKKSEGEEAPTAS